MVLDWFGGASKESGIQAQIARKNYGKALELLRAELQKRRHDRRLRMQLADVLALSGKPKEAVEVLTALADDLALKGQSAQAIAVLKKIQTLAPGREETEEKLAYLITQQAAPAPDPWARAGSPREPELGMEIGIDMAPLSVDDAPPTTNDAGGAIAGAADSAGAEPSTGTPGAQAEPPSAELVAPAPALSSPAAPAASAELGDAATRDELVAMIESALTLPEGADHVSATVDDPVSQTPLFRDFSSEELVAVMRGLRLVTFSPGEIVVTEGEPGHSLFVLTTGLVRAYVRDAAGHNTQVRELREGDFFGEISILSGHARTATITAAGRCELLELDRATLDGITQTHPGVWNVLKEFHDQRRNNL